MFKLYLISTIGCFLGWIRFTPYISKYRWLSGLFYFIAIIALGWGSFQIANLMNTTTNSQAIILFVFYFGYLFVLTILLYYLVKYFKNEK